MRTWIIGNSADCDLVVARPTVSGRHCRLTEIADGYLLEDLGSSNGTYVNGERIAAATRVSASDVITLGMKVPMSWPEATASPGARIVRIGRDADNDIVLDDPRVSSHHARLIVSGSQLIEDRFAVGDSSLPAMPGGH
jgi:pSer/pThr/pTyr-binding forkhead associated (FHA) protein